jgi:hypothetical protein
MRDDVKGEPALDPLRSYDAWGEAVRLSFSYPRVDVNCLRDLAVPGLQLPAFLAGGHVPGKYSAACLFQLGICPESMVCGQGKRFFLRVGTGPFVRF